MPAPAPKLRLHDAVFMLGVAAYIHEDPNKIRQTAQRLFYRLTRSKRGVMALIVASKDPHTHIQLMLEDLDNEQPPLPSLD